MTCMTAILLGQIVTTHCRPATMAECEAEKPQIIAFVQSAFPDRAADLELTCTPSEES